MLMKLAALSLLCCAVFSEEPAQRIKTLVGIHYNVIDGELCWDLMIGRLEGEKIIGEKLDLQSCISAEKAEMTYAGETRTFSREEASQLAKLLDVLANYAAESSVWFDAGKGDKKASPSENSIKAAVHLK